MSEDLIFQLIFFVVWYLVLCGLVANAGNYRTIGSASVFIISVFFTPLAGAIAILLSRRNTNLTLYEDVLEFHQLTAKGEDKLNRREQIRIKHLERALKESDYNINRR